MLCAWAQSVSPGCHRFSFSPRRSFLGTPSSSRLHRVSQAEALFGRGKRDAERQAEGENLVSPSWGEELPDWTDAPEQLDLLEEIWYEVCIV